MRLRSYKKILEDNGESMENQEKKAVLAVSFGTRFKETREKTLDVIEKDIREAFPGYEFCRAYTSPTVRRILQQRDGICVDDVAGALDRLWKEGYQKVVAQATHVIRGFEYNRMKDTLEGYRGRFDRLSYGGPLLAGEEDYRKVVRILGRELGPYRGPGTALVFMGHGTGHEANASYAKLQQAFMEEGFEDCLVGTVEASPTLENMMKQVRSRRSRKVVLTPFLVVAGDHAHKDMAGDGEGSWKSRFLRSGYEVECVMRGLGEYAGIRQIYVGHGKEAEKEAENV